jgi:hypothetical protein
MPVILIARPPYQKRAVPHVFEHGWWVTELGNIQRAIPTYAQKTITAAYLPTASDRTLICDCSTAAVTLGLPAPDRVKGLELIIKHIAGAFPVQLIGTVDGVVDPTIPNVGDCWTIQTDGVRWFKTAVLP